MQGSYGVWKKFRKFVDWKNPEKSFFWSGSIERNNFPDYIF